MREFSILCWNVLVQHLLPEIDLRFDGVKLDFGVPALSCRQSHKAHVYISLGLLLAAEGFNGLDKTF